MSQSIPLGPFRGLNSQRVADRALSGMYMRGGFNVELRDGEWWSRKGEECILPRVGSTPWWWIFDANRDLTIMCNAWYAVALIETATNTYGVSGLASASTTESTTFTNGATTCTPTSARTVGQLMLVGTQPTTEVYRVISRLAGAPFTVTLDRAYEGTTGAKNVSYYRPLAQAFGGGLTDHDSLARVIGSAVIFEQLTTRAANAVSTSSPAVTQGHIYLVITSNQGTPVAIDLTAYMSGSPTSVLRSWFALTNLGPATFDEIGSDTAVDGITPRGAYASVYKNRLFIGAAADPDNMYGSRTLYWSTYGDFTTWHSGVAGETAAPNYKTFDGEGNSIGGMETLGDDLVIHRDDTQEICTATQSATTPFVFRTNNENLGIRDYRRSNRVVVANGRHYIWTRRGPYAFDGRNLTALAEDVRGALRWRRFMQVRGAIRHVVHDSQNGRIYWFAANDASRWTNYTLPASANLTTPDTGVATNTYQNYHGVFVYDYESDESWIEDRPTSIGGGMTAVNSGQPAQAFVSRVNGTIICLNGRSKGKDASHSAPETAASDVTVTCLVETPWIDFGSRTMKRLSRIVTFERALAGEGPWDNYTDTDTGNLALRIDVYGDFDPETRLAYFTSFYSSTDTQLTAETVAQAATCLRDFSPRADARAFKFIITNLLSTGAAFVSGKSAPFRISDIEVDIVPMSSNQPLTTINTGTSLSGV